jgi:hypothetical protein
MRPTSLQQAGSVGRTRVDSCTRGRDQGRMHRRDQASIANGHGDFQCLSRSIDVTHPGYSPTPEVSSEGLDGGQSSSGTPARGTGLWHQSMGLSL